EVGVGREKVLAAGVQVCEVAPPAAGDEDLLAGTLGALKQRHPPAPLSRFGGAEQSGSACAQNDDVESPAHGTAFSQVWRRNRKTENPAEEGGGVPGNQPGQGAGLCAPGLPAQCVHFGKSVTSTIRSESVKSH